MLNLNRTPWRVLLGLFLMALCTTPVLVAQAPQLAAAELGGTVVSWQPQIQYDQLTLRIDGPAGTFTRIFEEGEVPFFDLASLDGPVDGSYTFELTASPRLAPEVRQTLQAARERGEDLGLERKLRTEGFLPAEPLVQSGYLRVVGGQFVSPDGDEPTLDGGALQPRTAGGDGVSSTGGDSIRNISAADQVILDDLIVDGSACIGQDCVNGESFGFDTLRLKENNLRIKFQDTSSSGSFPSNDWQLTANDSSNGGANKFSIDDIDGGRTPFTIEASAPTHSLYVDDGGRVGFGTSTPVVELHVVDGDTPTLRLEQNGSSGFTPQTWDVAGNEAGFFVRDVTNGSALAFRILPGASSESLVIDGSDEVGIGAGTNPTASLHVKRTNGTAKVLVEEGSGTPGQRTLMQLTNNGGVQFRMTDESASGGTGVTWVFQNSSGEFTITDAGDGTNEMQVDETGNMTIAGSLTTATQTIPDYVFAEDYDLMALDELAAFIKKRRHLPNVPSADEVAETGKLNMSDFQLRLLEKIEELTLYTLSQHETIELLHNGVEAKDQRIDELEARLAQLEELVAE